MLVNLPESVDRFLSIIIVHPVWPDNVVLGIIGIILLVPLQIPQLFHRYTAGRHIQKSSIDTSKMSRHAELFHGAVVPSLMFVLVSGRLIGMVWEGA